MVCKACSVLKLFNLNRSDGKEARQAMEQAANDVDHVKRSYHLTSSALTEEPIHHFRNSIAGEHPQLALPAGSVD